MTTENAATQAGTHAVSPVLWIILIVAAVAVVGWICYRRARGQKRYTPPQSIRRQETPYIPEGTATAPEKKLLPAAEVGRLYDERSRLEEEIMGLIGGGTGLRVVWENIVECAEKANDSRFLFYARPIPELTRKLKGYYSQLTDIIQMGKSRDYEPTETAAGVFAPYMRASECETLIRRGEYLADSGLAERESITAQELKSWLDGLPS